MVNLKTKPFNLSDEQIEWVNKTIDSLTEEEKVQQLFVHLSGAYDDEQMVKEETSTMKMGGLRFNPRDKEKIWNMNRLFQEYSIVPILSAVNVESGGNGATSDGTNVGPEIKITATNDSKYAYELGRICGIETRAVGCNWAFAPIVDITYNWHNPVISTRAWGNDPDKVLENSLQYFKGISESGIACAMKHFPGDGMDERDQHVATSVNTKSCKEWDETYGKVFKGMIDAGVQSIMPGHIMMPAYQKHFNPNLKEDEYLPATICKELLTDLLRGKLGFNGLIVTDASHMVGLAGRAKRSELVPMSIMAGADMFLFYNDYEEDVKYMLDALHDGRLTKERLHDALLRIMALKASVGLDSYSIDNYPKENLNLVGKEEYKQIVREVADKGITLVKNTQKDVFPITDKKRILLVNVGPEPSPMLVQAGMMADGSKLIKSFKEKLEAKGHEVEIYIDPVEKMIKAMANMSDEERASAALNKKGAYGLKTSIASLTDKYDLVICVANVSATMRTTQRLEWKISKGGWDNPWYVNEIPTIFISFNCPFHLADVSQVKNFINCYDSLDITVDELVKKLEGESEFKGISPVDAFCGLIDTRF